MTTPTEPAAEAVRNNTENTSDGQASDADQIGNEAAKYRRRLRDTEAQLNQVRDELTAERDTLAARLDRFQRGEVERLAADKLADPADVWRDGAELSGLLDGDGNIDPAAVGGLLDGLIETHSHWAVQQKTMRPPGGLRSGASAQQQPKQSASFAGGRTSQTGPQR